MSCEGNFGTQSLADETGTAALVNSVYSSANSAAVCAPGLEIARLLNLSLRFWIFH
jgi:hypothetical protein